MSYSLLSETHPVARVEHRCIWCGQKILKGERYTAERSVYDGEMQNHHWHAECLRAARADSELDWEFNAYDNERPAVSTDEHLGRDPQQAKASGQ